MKIGPCPECGEELAADQRYCVNCGSRVENSLAPSYLPVFGGSDGGAATRRGFPMPIPIAGTFAAVALAFGVVLGTAISPNVSGLVAGEHAGGPVVVQAPEPKPDPQKKGGGDNDGGSGGFGGSGFSGSSFGSGFYGSSGSGGSTTGTGGVPSDDKKKKPKPDYTYLSGTVVHQNPVAASYSISAGTGLSAIHTDAALPVVGTKVKVPIRVLANGTYAEEAKRQVQGTATSVKFSGVVTDSRGLTSGDPDVYSLSARGASVLVFAPDPTGTTAPPGVGDLVSTTVEIRNAAAVSYPAAPPPVASCEPPAPAFPVPPIFPSKQLFQTAPPTPLTATPVTSTVIETVVQSTCTAPVGAAVLSSDDVRQGESDVRLRTAAGIDPGKLIPGQAVMASVTIAAGKLTEVTGTASDQGIKGADSNAGSQGNLARVARKTEVRIAKASSRPRR